MNRIRNGLFRQRQGARLSGLVAEMRHLWALDSDRNQLSKTLPDPLVCVAVGERIGLRQARCAKRPPLTFAIGV